MNLRVPVPVNNELRNTEYHNIWTAHLTYMLLSTNDKEVFY